MFNEVSEKKLKHLILQPEEIKMTGNEKWRDNQKLFSKEKLKFIVAPMVEQSELAWRYYQIVLAI
jgi:hypothetical protein